MSPVLPHVVIGAGGHAKVLVALLKRLGLPVLGLTDSDPARKGESVLGIPVMGDDDWALGLDPTTVLLVNGIGSAGVPRLRRKMFDIFTAKGFRFPALIDPTALVAEDVEMGDGSQVMARGVINPSVRIGADSIVNTGVIVEHDCRIGAHCHLSPGAVICGGAVLGDLVHLGAGATVIPQIRIGEGCVIGAGAAAVEDVAGGVTVLGVPARPKAP